VGADLRAVGKDEKAPASKKPMTLSEAIAKGTRRDVLVANRDLIVAALEGKATAASVAALTKRLQETMNEIDAYDAAAKKADGEAGSSRDDVGDGKFDAAAV
jgi:hypothetical protein